MKKWKKLLVLVFCVGMIGSMTACGSNGTTDKVNDATSGQDKTDNTDTTNKDTTNNTTNKDTTTNNETVDNNGTDKNGDGVIDDAVDHVENGVNDIVDNGTENNGADHNTTDNKENAR